MTKYEIREVVSGKGFALDQFYDCISEAVFSPTKSKIEAIYSSYLHNDGKFLYGAFCGAQLIGVLAITGGKCNVIEYLGVDPRFRKQNIGRTLVEYVTRVCTGPLLAETDDESVEFYRKVGFQTEKVTRDFGEKRVTRYQCRKSPP